MTQQAFEQEQYSQQGSVLPTQLCYKCGGVVLEGTAFCDACRGTALFQKVSKSRLGTEQKQEKAKILRTTISQVAHKQDRNGKVGAAIGALVVLMSFAGACGYYFMCMPH